MNHENQNKCKRIEILKLECAFSNKYFHTRLDLHLLNIKCCYQKLDYPLLINTQAIHCADLREKQRAFTLLRYLKLQNKRTRNKFLQHKEKIQICNNKELQYTFNNQKYIKKIYQPKK